LQRPTERGAERGSVCGWGVGMKHLYRDPDHGSKC